MTASAYRQAIDALPYGKRLPGAIYLLDPGDDPRIPSLLRVTVAELRKRMDIGAEFNLLKFHTTSPKISFLAYPDFEQHPHPALAEAVIVDLIPARFPSLAHPPLHRLGVALAQARLAQGPQGQARSLRYPPRIARRLLGSGP